MKAIQLAHSVITTISSRQDGSARLSIATPELTVNEKAELMNLQGINVEVLLNPLEEKAEDVLKVDTEAGEKSPSQMLRAKLYVLWKKKYKEKGDEKYRTPEEYYRVVMNSYCDMVQVEIDKFNL